MNTNFTDLKFPSHVEVRSLYHKYVELSKE